MLKIYQRIVRLLGQSEDVLEQFVAELGEMPTDDHEAKYSRVVCFSNYGFRLCFDKPSRLCSCIEFHVHTTAVESGKMRSYPGDFPYAIAESDRRKQVEQKVGIRAIRSEIPGGPRRKLGYHRDSYSLPEYRLSFLFDKRTGTMDRMGVNWHDPNAEGLEYFPPFETSADAANDTL